jgi:hypothetical protein
VAPFVVGQWLVARVNIDYHVAVDGHFYSVPYRLVHRRLDVFLTATAVAISCNVPAVPKALSGMRDHNPGGLSASPTGSRICRRASGDGSASLLPLCVMPAADLCRRRKRARHTIFPSRVSRT